MEEKTPRFGTARAARAGKPMAASARLRLDHAALGALLVPTPTQPIISAINMFSISTMNSRKSGGIDRNVS
jgi:hypothetical protein